MRNLLIIGVLAFVAVFWWSGIWRLPSEISSSIVGMPGSIKPLSARPKQDLTVAPRFRKSKRKDGGASVQVADPHAAEPPVLSEEDFERAIDEKNACDLIRENIPGHVSMLLVRRQIYRRKEFGAYDPELGNFPLDTFLEALTASDAETALKILSRSFSESPILKFFEALIYADLLDGRPNPKPDYSKAIGILAALKQKVPDNGAISFFLASVRIRAGESESAIRADLHGAMMKEKFDSYITRILKIIWETGLSDPKLFALSGSLIGRMPSPNYGRGFSAIRERVTEVDLEWARQALDLGKRWMREGLYEKNRSPGIYWSVLEYQLGRQLARKAFVVLNPGSDAKITENDWPQVVNLGASQRPIPWDHTNFPPMANGGISCDESAFQKHIKQLSQEAQEHQLDLPRRKSSDRL